MKSFAALACLTLLVWPAFGQSARGTITGTIADPAGAMVPEAAIEAKNIETGAVYQAASTATGNYTIAQLPAGVYELSVAMPGFKKFVRQGLTVLVAQTLRIDVALEVGAITESVTVNADAPLLKTESGELSHNVSTDRLNDLPVLGIGASAGSSGIRNPYAVTQLLPGTTYIGNTTVRLNGLPGNTQNFRIEGQDSTNGLWTQTSQMNQPSVDAIQEFAVQTSNYAAEYGQAGGGFFNVTMKSGTNQFHGSAYDYMVNEALNAGQPFTRDSKGELLRVPQRRHNYGFTFGGPVWIPNVYDGHDRTFFFFNWEEFRETQNFFIPTTIPTTAYRAGDFRTALGRSLSTDVLGRPIIENQIYDPRTTRTATGLDGKQYVVRDPFPNNQIPSTLFDPVALKIQALMPPVDNAGLVNNYTPAFPGKRVTNIPAVKIDHSVGARGKISGYWSRTYTEAAISPQYGQADGLPSPITQARGTYLPVHTIRINYDHTLTPTTLLHLGAGVIHLKFADDVENTKFNPVQEIGLKGTNATIFPRMTGMNSAFGGMANMGPVAQSTIWNTKPTANASITWVRNNHTYKAGAEMLLEGYPALITGASVGIFNFSAAESSLPYTQGVPISGGAVGFPYANFLMGRVNNGTIGTPSKTRLGSHSFALFVQDTWKVTRTFTLDYGIRWDYQSYLSEQYGRMPTFSATTPNPSTGNILGATIFEGFGPGRCNCSFANVYPYAIGPRLGAAYQFNPKTVLRAGWGISYSKTAQNTFMSQFFSAQLPYAAPTYGDPATLLKDGVPITITWPNFDSGQYPVPGGATRTAPPTHVDRNAGRPARVIQWSIGIQREITPNLAVEATYAGNRGAWWSAQNQQAVNTNGLSPARLASLGFDLNNANDVALLNRPLSLASGTDPRVKLPYQGFPLGATVAQSLRPFPQFGTIPATWAPLGRTWYDSLQIKVSKRYSYGLDFSAAFAWQKELTVSAETADPNLNIAPAINNVFDWKSNKYISGLSKPVSLVIAANYTLPRLNTNSVLSWAIRNWRFGTVLQYASGLPIRVPSANNGLGNVTFQNTFANRVPGEPLFTKDLNCNCFDPRTEFVLNPKAWADPAPGQFGTSAAYYGDYRYQRRPSEAFSVGRIFRIREGVTFQIRAEFTNILNRTQVNNPVPTNAQATQRRDAAGNTTAGFGWINTASVFARPREGTLVARFSF